MDKSVGNPNGITMPPLYNQRAGHMWDIISQHVDFKGKSVIDLGCGHGDLLVRAYAAGATHLFGYDKDLDALNDTRQKLESIQAVLNTGKVYLEQCDMVSVECQKDWKSIHCDIAICCSVLPYLQYYPIYPDTLSFPSGILKLMFDNAPLSIIECQYAGDGPGFNSIPDDIIMGVWLENAAGWSTVTPIGKTFVEGRDKWRTIWKCER